MKTSDIPVLDARNPNPARVCNALMGGKDHYDVDRVVAEPLLAGQLAIAMAEARRFARRAVEYLSIAHGVTQVVELGCGLPLAPDIGDVAARANSNARTLYIDNDLLVATHAHALLKDPNGFVGEVDLTDITAVLAHITAVMDSTVPLTICLSGTAEFLSDAPDVLGALARQLPPGTWIVFSHITGELADDDIGSAVRALDGVGIAFHPRDLDTITTMLAPYRLAEPGLVAPHRWRPFETEHSALWPQHPENWDLSAYAAVGQLS
ncbi:SAM-dependent methyltransferase [Nocardia sp. GTS18]|uniref:SAM-dependent methyltransferase n=1 Tax=Nocardia sp. GTS18 TaxID=1778064 RepID=UPI001C68477B